MKKSPAIFILLILLTGCAIAFDNSSMPSQTDITKIGVGLNDATENVLERQVSIPGAIEVPAKVIFGIEQGMSWQQLIVLIGVWFMVFIIVFTAMDFMPFGDTGAIRFFISIVVTTLMSITHSFTYITTFFLGVSGSILGEQSKFKVIVAVAIAVLLIVIASIISGALKRNETISKAQIQGIRTGTALKKIEIESGR